jgi:hypothetical protein
MPAYVPAIDLLITYSYHDKDKLLDSTGISKKPVPSQTIRFTGFYTDPGIGSYDLCYHYPAENCRTWFVGCFHPALMSFVELIRNSGIGTKSLKQRGD